MKITLFIIAMLILGFHLANTKVNFKPFSINFETPYYPFAVLFLVLSISLFQIQSEKTAFKKGFEQGVKKSIEVIEAFNIEK